MTMRIEISIDHDYGEHRSSMIEALSEILTRDPYFRGRTVTFTFNDYGRQTTTPITICDGYYELAL